MASKRKSDPFVTLLSKQMCPPAEVEGQNRQGKKIVPIPVGEGQTKT